MKIKSSYPIKGTVKKIPLAIKKKLCYNKKRTDVRITFLKGFEIMEPCTYFILAVILMLISLGATAHTAAAATMAAAVVLTLGGLYTKFIIR